jgi:hypothetical protein
MVFMLLLPHIDFPEVIQVDTQARQFLFQYPDKFVLIGSGSRSETPLERSQATRRVAIELDKEAIRGNPIDGLRVSVDLDEPLVVYLVAPDLVPDGSLTHGFGQTSDQVIEGAQLS